MIAATWTSFQILIESGIPLYRNGQRHGCPDRSKVDASGNMVYKSRDGCRCAAPPSRAGLACGASVSSALAVT
jgi:hypothetical protein